MNKNKFIAITVFSLTAILAITAAFIGLRLYKTSKTPVSLPSPSAIVKQEVKKEEEEIEEKTAQIYQQAPFPCQINFTVAAASPSPSPSPEESPEPSPSPGESPSPSPSPNPSPSPSPREIVLVSPSPSPTASITPALPLAVQEPAEELPAAGTTLPTLIIAIGGLLLIALGFLI